MKEAFIVAAARTPFGKAPNGKLKTVRPDDMGALVIKELLKRTPQLDPTQIDDVIMGCGVPEGTSGMNVGRISCQVAGLPDSVPAMTVNRFCSSGLEVIAIGTQRIMSGMADIVLSCGTESMSQVPWKAVPNPYLAEHMPDAYLGMGFTAENLVSQYKITREEADAFSYQSHQKAIAAIEGGRLKDECFSVAVREVNLDKTGKKKIEEFQLEKDEGPRADTSPERLASLKPVFNPKGTVTAGNASQRSDGSAGVIIMSGEKVKELGLKPLGRLVTYAVGGVPPGVMGIGPVVAIPKALKQAGLKIDDIDLIELNEAFACQALAVVRGFPMPMEKMNVNGGAVALGHPFAATGGRMTATILNELKRRKKRYGLVTMCIGGGMGAAGIVENLS
jgi:acetyl-CoA acyltransferase